MADLIFESAQTNVWTDMVTYASSKKPLNKFYRFKKLPVKIRRKIWKIAPSKDELSRPGRRVGEPSQSEASRRAIYPVLRQFQRCLIRVADPGLVVSKSYDHVISASLKDKSYTNLCVDVLYVHSTEVLSRMLENQTLCDKPTQIALSGTAARCMSSGTTMKQFTDLKAAHVLDVTEEQNTIKMNLFKIGETSFKDMCTADRGTTIIPLAGTETVKHNLDVAGLNRKIKHLNLRSTGVFAILRLPHYGLKTMKEKKAELIEALHMQSPGASRS